MVGDRVRNIHSSLEFTIDKYGRLDNGSGLVFEKWNGADYKVIKQAGFNPMKDDDIIDLITESSEATPHSAPTPQPAPEPKPAPAPAPEPKKERKSLKGCRFVVIGGKRTCLRPGDPMPEATAANADAPKMPQNLGVWTDQQLADELRARGWDVVATRLVTL